MSNEMSTTDIFGNSDTCYNSDTTLTVTVLVNPMFPKSVTVSKYLLLVTQFLCPEGVTVTEDVCNKTTLCSADWFTRKSFNKGYSLAINSSSRLLVSFQVGK